LAEDLVTEQEAARLLGLTRAALSQRRREGKLHPFRSVRPILYRREYIEQLREERLASLSEKQLALHRARTQT
jgi:predicted transcriptional regulator